MKIKPMNKKISVIKSTIWIAMSIILLTFIGLTVFAVFVIHWVYNTAGISIIFELIFFGYGPLFALDIVIGWWTLEQFKELKFIKKQDSSSKKATAKN